MEKAMKYHKSRQKDRCLYLIPHIRKLFCGILHFFFLSFIKWLFCILECIGVPQTKAMGWRVRATPGTTPRQGLGSPDSQFCPKHCTSYSYPVTPLSSPLTSLSQPSREPPPAQTAIPAFEMEGAWGSMWP